MGSSKRQVLWQIEHRDMGLSIREKHKVLVSEWRLTPYVSTGKRVRLALHEKDGVEPIVAEATVNYVMAQCDDRQRVAEDRHALTLAIMDAFHEQKHPKAYKRWRQPTPRKGTLAHRLRDAEKRCVDLMEEVEALKGCRAGAIRLLDENEKLRAAAPPPTSKTTPRR